MLNPYPISTATSRGITRRQALKSAGAGFGYLALAGLLGETASASDRRAAPGPLAPRQPHFRARAKRIIFVFMEGAMSQMDTFEYKPQLQQDDEQVGPGGGTLTAYLMALDDRIVAAAPSCYLTSLERLFATIGPQDAEQNIFAQLAFGMDHADYVTMRAPSPVRERAPLRRPARAGLPPPPREPR